jgi:AbrB family looped-hinge helix DNA binding protein
MVGRRGTIVLPAKLRRRLGIEEGSIVVAEARADGILIRPAAVVPVEIYSPERRAEFLLNNAVKCARLSASVRGSEAPGPRSEQHQTPSTPNTTPIGASVLDRVFLDAKYRTPRPIGQMRDSIGSGIFETSSF